MAKKRTAASGVGPRHGGKSTQKKSTSTFNHATASAASLFVPFFDDGRYMGMRYFENRAAARAAMRQGALG